MDAEHFDRLARTLVAGSSRRHAVRLFGGLGVAILLGHRDTAAKRRHKKTRKKQRRPASPPPPISPPPPACAADGDYCATGTARCGDGGYCLRPLGGGASRCGYDLSFLTCGCTSDEQCVGLLGPGSFCAQDTGASCPCDSGVGFCSSSP